MMRSGSMSTLSVLLGLQGLLQSWAVMQCESGESDQIAHVQTNPKVLKGALEQEATGAWQPVCTEFETGVCDVNECHFCSPADPKIPNIEARFPNDFLFCGQDACRNGGKVFEFKNPLDYLHCGLFACINFNVKNVGGLCCDRGCQQSTIDLTSTSDVCCGNTNDACRQLTLTGVRNLACFGNSCKQVEPTMVGDLTVSGMNAGRAPGELGKFTFVGTQNHCVRSIGANAIRPFLRATFTFQQPSKIVMQCVGPAACEDATVYLPQSSSESSSCFHVTCNGDACFQFRVLPLPDGTQDFDCYCSGTNCGWTNQYTYCSTTTENPCGTNICPGNLPACVEDETAAAAQTMDCTRLANTAGAAGAGTVQGDPHLSTLDGRHYTLMQQGNFLLWSFSGYETEVLVKNAVKKVHVDFEIFAHYAGHASFTKGLLFVDKSSKPNQVLEVTAKDCLWHHRDGDASKQWQPVESALLKLADSDGSYGAFNLSMSKSGQRKLEISINHQGKVRTLAQLWVGCRAGHQLSAKIKMPSQKDFHFVRGELAPGRLSLATAAGGEEGEGYHEGNQMATDPEFALTSDWEDLGGSPAAASYFKAVDATGPAHAFKACEEAEKEEHAKTCQKHLADSAVSTGFLYQQAVDDCIFDLCRGGDETSAELAAEILNA